MSQRALVVAALAVGGPAAAQVDTQGFPTAPWSGEGPVRVTSPWRVGRLGWAANLGLRVTSPPLLAYVSEEGPPAQRVLVGTGIDVTVGGLFGVHDRLAVGLTLPARLASGGEQGGPAFGDLGVWAPITVVAGSSSSLAVVPRVLLPTGSAARFASAGGVRFGGELVGGLRRGPVGLALSAGAERAPDGTLPGGGFALGGLAADLRAGPWAVGVEGRARAGFGEAAARGLGTELVGVVRWHGARGQAALGGGGAPIGVEPGVAPALGFLLAGVHDRAPDAVVTPAEVRPTITVRDRDGNPVRGAVISDGGREVARTDADGSAPIPARRGLSVRAPGLAAGEIPVGAPEIVLGWEPVPLELRVTDTVGDPVQAELSIEPAAEDATRQPFGWSGSLAPGRYLVRVRAEGFGAQQRTVEVTPRRTEPVRVEVVLLPTDGASGRLDLSVLDPEQRPVEGARVLLDGVPVGTTASGGDVVVEGLPGVEGSVRVTSADYRDGEDVQVSLAAHADVELAYQPGTVRVRALGPDGAVTDGVLQIVGAVALPPLPLGADGERLVVLAPGTWAILLSSAALGVQERLVEVREDAPVPLLAEFVLQPEGEGGDLLVRVNGPDGAPLSGAEVALDGLGFGQTASAGTVRLQGVGPGPHTLTVTHPGIQPVQQALDVGEDLTEAVVTVRWRPDTVFVAATDGRYDPVDAMVQFDGSGQVPPGSLGARGRRYFDGIDPGAWELVLSSPEHGIQTRRVEVGGDALPTAVVVFRGEAGGSSRLEVRVEDPDGRAVGAPVWLDGAPIGRADAGELTVEGLTAGPREVSACDGALARTSAPVRVGTEGRVVVRCPWAPGATRVTVRAAGAPVTDALVRFGGPFPVRPAALDGSGQRVFALAPGPWSVLVSSAEHGILERAVQVGAEGLTELALELPTQAGTAFVVRVTEAGGRPVPDAEIRSGGRVLGRTDAGGALVLAEQAPRRLEVRSATHLPAEVRVPRGAPEQLVELALAPVPVGVTLAGPDGVRRAGVISAVGPAPFTPVAVDGAASIELAPGRWQVIATAPGLGTRRIDVEIAPGETGRTLVFALVPARVFWAGERLTVRDVSFELGAADFAPAFQELLEEVAAMCLADDGILRIEVQGHTDTTGDLAFNMELSARRAHAVRDALVALGVPPSRVEARGFGPTLPVAGNDTEEGRSANRRVEFRVVETRPAAEAPGG